MDNSAFDLFTDWLNESNESRAQEFLHSLILKHAELLVRRIVVSKLSDKASDDIDDVCNTALQYLPGAAWLPEIQFDLRRVDPQL